nr:uncharacterized protein LOC105486937 [Macaca nemestrina]
MSLLRAGACLSLILVSVGSIPVPGTAALEMEGIEGEQILKHSLHLSLLPSHPSVFQPEAFALRPRLWPIYHRYPSSTGRGNLKRKRGTGNGDTEKRPCEDMARRQPAASQGARPQKKPTLSTP